VNSPTGLSIVNLFVNKSMGRQFTLYVVMGGTATGVDWLSFYLLNVIGGLSYLWAVILSFFLGAMVNYLLNKFITFKDQTRQLMAQIGVYSFICALSLLVSIILMYVLVEGVRLWSMTARMVTTGIMLVLNFMVHRFITFNPQVYRRFTNVPR
jgi:putative flippase GtrA